ncbi:hypothetical protein, partial [Bradyrhizobium sp.]|uniref:hypothetical protein n=1 Tax=Bradyrhizobium sp. TaxID=376 RepID=UPI0040378123
MGGAFGEPRWLQSEWVSKRIVHPHGGNRGIYTFKLQIAGTVSPLSSEVEDEMHKRLAMPDDREDSASPRFKDADLHLRAQRLE